MSLQMRQNGTVLGYDVIGWNVCFLTISKFTMDILVWQNNSVSPDHVIFYAQWTLLLNKKNNNNNDIDFFIAWL